MSRHFLDPTLSPMHIVFDKGRLLSLKLNGGYANLAVEGVWILHLYWWRIICFKRKTSEPKPKTFGGFNICKISKVYLD